MIDLDAIEAAARAATPGPWHHCEPSPWSGDSANYDQTLVGQAGASSPFGTINRGEHRATGAYIAALSPDVVLALVAELRAGLETAHGRSLIRVIVERDALRRIISEAATSAGASVAPECSLEFLALLPREIALVVRSRDDAVAERDDLRRCLAETRDHMESRDVVRAQRVMAARLERDEAWGEIARLRKVVQERDDERSAFVASVRSSSEAMAAHLREAERERDASLEREAHARDDVALPPLLAAMLREADDLERAGRTMTAGGPDEDGEEALSWAAQLRRWARGER